MDRDDPTRPTLRTIARITGLSPATVSRALNDVAGISSKTRKRVKQVAREIGYSPSLAGKQLKKGRSDSIAVSLDSGLELHHGPAQFLRGAVHTASPRGFRCISVPLEFTDVGFSNLEKFISERIVDGVILNALRPQDDRVRVLEDAGIPYVTHGRAVSQSGTSYDYDNREFARQSIELFAERNPGPVLVIAPPRIQSYGQHVVAGAQEAAEATGLELVLPDTLSSDNDVTEIRNRVADILKENPDITSVLSCSTTAGLAAVSALGDISTTSARGVEVISKDCSRFLKSLHPRIITCQENFEDAGAFLVGALIDKINDPSLPPVHKLAPFAGFV